MERVLWWLSRWCHGNAKEKQEAAQLAPDAKLMQQVHRLTCGDCLVKSVLTIHVQLSKTSP